MQSQTCTDCGKDLTRDDIGMSCKLVSRATEVFWCMECLSRRTGIPEKSLRRKADEFRRMGCLLFQ